MTAPTMTREQAARLTREQLIELARRAARGARNANEIRAALAAVETEQESPR